MNKVIPSINCAEFACIKERIVTAGKFADWVHIDISDGKFTQHHFDKSNASFSKSNGFNQSGAGFTPHVSWNNPEELHQFRIQNSEFRINFEVHLMVEDPEAQVDSWLRAGAKRIIVHLESMRDPVYISEKCKQYGAEFFLAINPLTEVERLLVHLDDVAGVLALAVFPGPSGQKMRPEVLEKIKYLRENNPDLTIEIDGGVNLETAKLAKAAGANIFVSGAHIFNNSDPQKAYAELLKVID